MRLFAILLLASSCSLMMGGGKTPSAKDKSYQVKFNSPQWEVQSNDKRSDYVFQNKDGSILLSNSFCGEFQDEPLDRLAVKTFKGVSGFTSGEASWLTYRDREAYRLEGKGKVDGVSVGLRVLNTRRDNCYFDFISISPAGSEVSKEVFDGFLSSVVFK